MKRSHFSLRAPFLSATIRRQNFLRPQSTQRKQLRLESLEPRAVFAADCDVEMHVVFAPDTPTAVMAAYEDLTPQEGIANFTFDDTDRWSRTATNTTTLTQGDATVVRWSIVPDGTAVSGYNGEPAAPSNLRSWLAGIYGTNASSTAAADQPWFDEVQSVFDRWSAVSGVTYVYEAADDGAALSSQNAGSIGRRGDVRISGHYIDGPSNVLAYNFYPTVGDMVLDTGDTFFNNTGSNSIRLRNTMAHELGHGLGLDHVTPVNGTKLMEPSISLGYDGPQADDILAVNRGYGDRLEKNGGNNTPATAASLASGATFALDTLSIDDDSDVDWFQFTVGAGASLSVTLTPTGSTYTSNSTSFNSLTQSDLALAVYGSNGTTLLASANAGVAGVAETLTNFNLPASGTFYVRVTGSANAAQMYRLSGTLSNVVTTNSPEIAVLDGTTNIIDGSTAAVNLGSGAIGATISKTFTVQNTGNAALTLGTVSVPTGFVLTQAPLTTVAAGGSTTFAVALNTAVAGTFGGAISFANNDADENPFNFNLSGTVTTTPPVTAPEIEILDGATVLIDGASTVNFGSTTVGGTLTKTLTIRNLGTANLTLSQLVLPTRYSIVAGPSQTTIAPGGSATLTLGLNTSTVGTFSGAMSLANNDANEGPFNFNVIGIVTAQTPTTAPEISILDGTTELVDGSSTLNFSSVAVGGSSTKTLTIRNLGTANLTLSQIVLPTSYSLTAGPGITSLAPGAATTITLSLNTAAAGTFGGGVSLGNNDANEGPFNFNVTGTVTAPTTPTTQFSDNFNRQNSSSLGSNWTEKAGNYSINTQTLVNSTSSTSVAIVNSFSQSDVVLTANVDLAYTFGTRDSGLVARYSGNGIGSHYWGGLALRNGRYYAEIWEANNGNWTRLSQTQVTAASGALRFEVIGTSLKLYVNDVLRGSATDSTLTAGSVGVSSTGTATRVDNFTAAAAPAPAIAPAAITNQATANYSQQQSIEWLAVLDQLLAQWNQDRNR